MTTREHIIVAYGHKLGYYHGAKYQILKAWQSWYSNPDSSVCVVTDLPELFANYPVRILALSEEQMHAWSLAGIQHFGIKLKGIEWASATTDADIVCALDTDSYWVRDPSVLLSQLDASSVAMFCDEGPIQKSRNKSIQQFEKALSGKSYELDCGIQYQLNSSSKMLNSSLLALTEDNYGLLTEAFELFKTIEPVVNAHTVEQFSLAETFRRHSKQVTFGESSLKNWSSTGRKNYVTPVLRKFFFEFGEIEFKEHLKHVHKIKLRRPISTFLKQKMAKIWQ